MDVLTYLAVKRSGLTWQRVLGLGTQLDTARFRSHLARRLQVPPTQVQALILGEHGDSMVPIWSSATIAGLPLAQWPGCSPQLQKEAFEETKTAGAQLIKLKGGSGFRRRTSSIREVIHSLILDSSRRPTCEHAAIGSLRCSRRMPVGADCRRLRRSTATRGIDADGQGKDGHPKLGARAKRNHPAGGNAARPARGLRPHQRRNRKPNRRRLLQQPMVPASRLAPLGKP